MNPFEMTRVRRQGQ